MWKSQKVGCQTQKSQNFSASRQCGEICLHKPGEYFSKNLRLNGGRYVWEDSKLRMRKWCILRLRLLQNLLEYTPGGGEVFQG